MPIAAVPKYLQEKDPEFYLSAPPGHRFLLYFPAWGEHRETRKVDWRMADRVPRIDKKTKQQKVGESGPEWDDLPNDQFACTIAACKTPQHDEERPRARKPKADPGLKSWRPMMESLLARQCAAFAVRAGAETGLVIKARAVAPFTTGLGNEHPLENGFAFLNPYGLPYLPGSGVKGVLRQAAKELASGQWADQQGWSEEKPYSIQIDRDTTIRLSLLDVLFGRETEAGDKDHVRGALSFWDVIPQIEDDHLMVEIMTPHQSHYYQQKPAAGSTNPHDSGQPNPISFLTVPPGSQFIFHVVCDVAHLKRLTDNKQPGAPDLLAEGETNWKTLLEAAFKHAFTWLGFGAKTAVGYGAMEPAHDRDCAGAKPTGESQAVGTDAMATPRGSRVPQAPRVTSHEEVWHSASITHNKGGGGIVTAQAERKKAEARGPAAAAFLDSLSEEQRRRLKKKGQLEGIAVVVKVEGNLRTLVRLASLNKGDAE
jgi:CRISPR-associated protein Cmr6